MMPTISIEMQNPEMLLIFPTWTITKQIHEGSAKLLADLTIGPIELLHLGNNSVPNYGKHSCAVRRGPKTRGE